ncbi:unnamed protein product, partial [Durusdinium trenchii]
GFHLGARVEEPHGRLLALHLPGRGRGRHCRPGGGGAEEFALAARRHAEAATGSAARRQADLPGFTGFEPNLAVDGPNIGYRGAVQRRRRAEGPREGSGAKNYRADEEEVVENLHAPYFRHDQIHQTLEQLRSQNHWPLLVMPCRYAFAGGPADGDASVQRPLTPLNDWVTRWM